MKRETPRTPDGAKLCAWCGGEIKQSGVGRSRDYCRRLCRDQAYKQRRDQRLIEAALADARPVSPSVETGPGGAVISPDGETGFGQVAPLIPAPAVPEEDYLLAPPEPRADPAPGVVLPDAWRAPAPRRQLGQGPGRRRANMTASAIPLPLPFEGLEDDEGL
ncbi:hypothetical protein [Streptomyces sp. NPDC058677]|uniref:hypothetical protein n=1 Tax=Streptomyces sp. NPDC058677 TaxID=3346594 RepID=UPI0036514CD4